MTDNLVKRLDQALHFENWMPVPENFSEAVPLLRESRNRIEELEAKLAKAVKVLKGVMALAEDMEPHALQGNTLVFSLEKARATLAELKGQDDE